MLAGLQTHTSLEGSLSLSLSAAASRGRWGCPDFPDSAVSLAPSVATPRQNGALLVNSLDSDGSVENLQALNPSKNIKGWMRSSVELLSDRSYP